MIADLPHQRLLQALVEVSAAQKLTPRGPAKRGRRYLRRVGEFEIRDQLSGATVLVQGSQPEPYTVAIDLEEEEEPWATCSCPYSDHRGPCKHTWAALEVLSQEILRALAAQRRTQQQRAPWQNSLQRLDAFLGGESATSSDAVDAQPETRVVWRVEFPRRRAPSVTPYEQSRKKRGGYTKGRKVGLARLAAPSSAWWQPEVRAVARLVEARRTRRHYYYEEVSYDLDACAALAELVGSQHVYLTDPPDRRIEVVRAQLGFRLTPLRNGAIDLVPTLEGVPLRRFPDAAARLLIQFDEESSRVLVADPGGRALELLSGLAEREARRFPEAHAAELLTRLGPLERQFPLEVPPALQGEARAGDSRLRLLLAPSEGGLLIQARVRPAGSGGTLELPGSGETALTVWAEGRRALYTRDFGAELETTAEVLGWLAPEDAPEVLAETGLPWTWEVLGEQALDLVASVQDLDPAVCVAEWPEGEPLSVSRELTPADLRVSVRERRDWFGLEGGVEVDGTEVPLTALLKLEPGARYLPLEGGRWLRLSELLRQQISSLRDVSHASPKRVEVDVTAAPALEELLAEAGEVEECEGWGEVRARLARARRVSTTPPAKLRAELRPYQREGFAWLKRLSTWGVGACLADDMGLGKTIQAIALLLTRVSSGPALVVAPTSVGGNWRHELERFAPSLNAILYRETDRAVVLEGLKKRDVVIVSYDLARIDRARLGEVEWGTLVFDEAQQVKNGASKTARALQTLPGKWRLALTGTPVENHLGELWALFRLISPGLFGGWEGFKARFAAPIERDNDGERREALARLIQPFVLRRTKEEVLPDLPERSDVLLEVELSAREREAYQAARLAAILDLSNQDGKDARFQVLAAITKLRQLACHPRLVDPGWEGGSAKLSAFKTLLTDLREGGHRALVFSQFTRHLALVRELLEREEIPYLYLDGKTSARRRQERVDAFQGGEGSVFLISLKAGGRGLNLTGADYVIHLDPWWNPAVEDQASDRAHRLGQTRPVTVYRLVAKGTIEEQILDLHAEKRDLVEGILAGADRAARLSSEELLALVRGGAQPSPPTARAPRNPTPPARPGRPTARPESAGPEFSLKALREKHSLTQTELGRAFGVVASTLCRWEQHGLPARHQSTLRDLSRLSTADIRERAAP